ncbi:TIR domain-containing protein [Fusobacterium polymorphum]|uniref:TIR domain-containing protein n=1 Tax=Fusobacterium nucleatum subsp. polymorphum TaxID=76857 RepID=UPI0029225C10|nr:TIR domain-containing protein [Fusobacterium nucleatum]BEP07161.1 TIR domain-containing protein [Fusobacterium nucleatum]
MARRVFFSFHYEEDINRSMVVRNSWVTQGKEVAGFIDKVEFEKVKKEGKEAICRWIDKQLVGTSVTVVLIGKETLNRPFVQYEIRKSVERGNAIIGVCIHNIKDMITQKTSVKGNPHTIIGYYDGKIPAYFDDICDGLYDYLEDNGYFNLGIWIEEAAQKKDK